MTNFFKAPNKVAQFKKESTEALNIFQQTVDSLEETNERVNAERKAINEKKALLEEEEEERELCSIEEENDKIVNKIKAFLS